MNKLEKAIFNRTELLLGADVMQALSEVRVILFGVGGVGSWCAEGLVRSGVKHLTIVDSDRVSITNVNRQLMATTKTVGQVKVEALKNHLLEINPDAEIEAIQAIYCEDTADRFDLDSYDYVVDAVDSLKDKALLILRATASKAKFYCSLGAALKTNPLKVQVAEFWDVRGCPLGAALRKKMKRAGTFPAHKFLCVYDDEVLENRGADSVGEVEDGFHVDCGHGSYGEAEGCPEGVSASCASGSSAEVCFQANCGHDGSSGEAEDRFEGVRSNCCPDGTGIIAQDGPGDPALLNHDWSTSKAQINGTTVHITAIFGMTLSGLIIDDIYHRVLRATCP